jgi:hypothetical protein
MIDTYRRLLFTHGYETASLFCYLVYMADEEGKIEVSLRTLSVTTGISYRQVRASLMILQAYHLLDHSAYHQGTIVTICNYDSYATKKKGKRITSRITPRIDSVSLKESPPSSPLDVSPHTPLLNPPYNPPKETHSLSACERFSAWLSRECPYISANLKPVTEEELAKLKQRFSTEEIMEVCHEMENRKDLRKRYTNLYRTLLNWLKKRNERNRTTNQNTAAERINEAAQLVQRMGDPNYSAIRGFDWIAD